MDWNYESEESGTDEGPTSDGLTRSERAWRRAATKRCREVAVLLLGLQIGDPPRPARLPFNDIIKPIIRMSLEPLWPAVAESYSQGELS